MLWNFTWHATDALARSQLAMFNALGDRISLTQDDRRRALKLDDRAWIAWSNFMSDGPLPAEPKLPEMLLRLGTASFRLTVVASGAEVNA